MLKHGDRIRLAGSDMTFIFRQEGPSTQPMGVGAPATGAFVVAKGSSEQADQPAADPQLEGKEADLLRFLESQKGTPVSREDIARSVWPELPTGSATNQVIDDAIEGVREHIEEDPESPAKLITVGEFGYLLI